MNIIKPLHLGALHKSFSWRGRDVFAVGVPIPFSLLDGEILLEQAMWGTISEQLSDGLFDTAMPKHQGEMLVAGSFFAPAGQRVEAGEVRVQLGTIDKHLRVYPPRRWRKLLGAGVAIASDPAVSEVPIRYDLAFGGDGFSRNPVGIGYCPVASERGEIHPLPQIEYRQQPVTAPGGDYAPAALGRIDPMWSQRLGRAGTYDEAYLRERMPGLPDDIDWRYFNEAAEDQWIDGWFSGNEAFRIEHMHPQHALLAGELPAIYGRAFVNQRQDGKTCFREIPTRLDTVWFFPAAAMGVMIYRGSIEAGSDDGSDIKALLLACENRGDTPRPVSHYQQQMSLRLDPDHGFKYALYTAPLIAEGMTCGFQQIRDANDFPLDMETQKNLDRLVAEKTTAAAQQQADAMAELESRLQAAGVDPQPHLEQIRQAPADPLQQKMNALLEKVLPGVTTNPGNPDLTRLDLKAMDEVKALGDEIRKDKLKLTRQTLQEQIDELKARPDANRHAAAIAELERALAALDLPPMWPRADLTAQLQSIREQLARAEQQLAELRKMGVADDRLPALNLDLVELESRLKDAEERLKDTYRRSAHTLGACRSPHMGQEATLRQQLLDARQSGAAVAGLDFACVDVGGESFRDLDLSGCYLEGVNFSGCRFERVNFSGAILAGCNLSGATLIDCDCRGANLGAADMSGLNLLRVNLAGAILGRSHLAASSFDDCDMAEITFLESTFDKPRFINCRMPKCNLIDAVLNGASFEGSDLTESNLIKPQLQNVNFDRATLNGVNCYEARLVGSHFRNATMINSRFVGNCDMSGCDFTGADISKSCLRENRLDGSRFTEARLDETDLGGASLRNSHFELARGYRAQFMKADLTDARLVNMNLMEGSLYKAMLVGADFSGANLYCVNFMDATLGANRYLGANLDQTILRDWRPS